MLVYIFGGDPKRVTIAGAICESGTAIAGLPPRPLAETGQNGMKFASAAGADSLIALRAMTAQQPQAPRGAVHTAEIQYAMGNLDLDKRYRWEPADHEVSKTMQAYFVNFIKTGNPGGPGLPPWPACRPETNCQRMRIDVTLQAEPEPHRERYLALDAVIGR